MANNDLNFRGSKYPLPQSQARCVCVPDADEEVGNWTFRLEGSSLTALCIGCSFVKSVRCKWCNSPTFTEYINEVNQRLPECVDCRKRFNSVSHTKNQRRPKRARLIAQQVHGRIGSEVIGPPAKRLECSNCHDIIDVMNAEVAHITPIAKGGEPCLQNTVLLCRPCRKAKTSVDFGHDRGERRCPSNTGK